MDNLNRQVNHLGVNKMGKNIKKSPMHQPNFSSPARQQPQAQVYNINKSEFRNIVQQLTGSPSHHQEPILPRPPQNNSPKPTSMRLQKIRPPPLNQINRPPMPMHPPALLPPPAQPQYNNSFARPPPPQYVHGQPSPNMMPQHFNRGDAWGNTAESPISAYMRYLQHSIVDPAQRPPQPYPHPNHPPGRGSNLGHPPGPGLLPNPHIPPVPSPRMNGLPPFPSPRMNGPPPLPSPRMNGPPPLPSPRMNGPPPGPGLPSPRMNGPPPLLASPTSQFLLPSPNGFFNMLSPRSPYPLLSPGYQYPPPMTPDFSFSPMGQSGILGPGPQMPPSPGYGFPLSPSGFFTIPSPRWRD